VQLQELSMGMSGDFEVAIEEGATLIPLRTAVFSDLEATCLASRSGILVTPLHK